VVPDEVPEDVLATPLTHRLAARAADPRPAFTQLDCSGGAELAERTLTWAGLLVRVRAVAAALRELVEPGERVAIIARQDLSYVVAFFGALYAGAVAVPLSAPDLRAQRERLVGALADCDAAVWLTSEPLLERVRELAGVPQPRAIVAVDTLAGAGEFPPAPVRPEDPAYLQYTSGTTRSPAGVVISHRALAAACWQVCAAYAVDSAVTCVGWIPFFHDMGLIQLVCGPVHSGGRSVFLAPLEFVRRPARWLTMMSAYPKTLTAAPNFAYDLLVEAVPEARRREFDLSGVHVALNGSEPVRAKTVEAFLAAYEPYGFPRGAYRPSYGLAEGTVFVAGGDAKGPFVTEVDGRELVSAGRPSGQRLRIVDPECRVPVPDGETGEIWVHGPNVADGYWRRPELTAAVFGGRLDGEDGWLRTGDLGRWDGERLYVTGRIRDLVIVDGRNHYPQDIEETVAAAHPVLGPDRIAAFGVDDPAGEKLVVVAERARGAAGAEASEDEVARAAKRAVVTGHDLRVHAFLLVKPGSLPRTSSGKVSRSAARIRFWAKRPR
jgi:long chain fatty acid CoA FadD26